jgi:hypothetical protein
VQLLADGQIDGLKMRLEQSRIRAPAVGLSLKTRQRGQGAQGPEASGLFDGWPVCPEPSINPIEAQQAR